MSFVVAGIHEGQPYALDGGDRKELPPGGAWKLGDFELPRDAAFAISPSEYTLSAKSGPDWQAWERPFQADVLRLAELLKQFGQSPPQVNGKDRQGRAPGSRVQAERERLMVSAWCVDGRATEVVLGPGPVFELAQADRGFPVLLVFEGAGFLARPDSDTSNAADLLMAAAAMADLSGVRKALAGGARLNTTDSRGATALHLAALHGHESVAGLLISEGADLNAADARGETPLHVAAARGRTRMVRLLIGAGARVSARNQQKTTALHLAAQNGHLELVEALVKAGAKVSAADQRRDTPFSVAFNANRGAVAEYLLNHGATFGASTRFGQWLSGPKDRALLSPFLVAKSADGQIRLVRMLLARNVDLDAELGGVTALVAAAEEGSPDLVRLLIDSGATVDRRSHQGKTALMQALRSGNLPVANLLIERGADPNARDEKGISCLHYAVSGESLDCIRLLLEHGADPNGADEDGMVPLMLATAVAEDGLVDVLLARGARWNNASAVALSMLEHAFRRDLAPVVADALSQGLPPDFEFDEGWPALAAAQLFGAQRVAELLRGAGASGSSGPEFASPRHLDVLPTLAKGENPVLDEEILKALNCTEIGIEMVIDRTGQVRFPRIPSCDMPRPEFFTLEGIRTWKFNPPQLNGTPVNARFLVPVKLESKGGVLELAELDAPPRPLVQKQPLYPPYLSRKRVEGRVVMRCIVDREGRVRNPTIISSTHTGFEEPSLNAIAGWEFEPGYRGGRPVAVRIEIPFRFNL